MRVAESLLLTGGADALVESVRRLDELLEQTVRLCKNLYSRPDFRS